MPVEMPGDYHFHHAPPPPPARHPSDRDSTLSSYSSPRVSRWSQSQQGSSNASRPASVQSDASGGGGGGGGGMHSPGLPTHEEMPEHDEHHHRGGLNEEALRRLDPVAARRAQYAASTPPPPTQSQSQSQPQPQPQAYAYNPADYVGMGGRAQSAGSYGYANN